MISIKLPSQKDYPKKIYIQAVCYRVIFKKNFAHFGETDGDRKVITIKAGLKPRAMLTTFIHELLHVIEFERPSTNLKHSQVYALEESIMELLLDNFL